jgi:tetratricopeptide (TPR) repeat protein
LTFPLVFICLAGPFGVRVAEAWLGKRYARARVVSGAIIGLWIIASVANVRVTIPLWKDDAVLNSWAIAQAGPSYWRYSNLGLHYLRIDDYQRARAAFAMAVQLRSDRHTAFIWNNLGIVEAGLGDWPQSMAAFNRALELDPEAITPRTNLARLARRGGDLERARVLLEEGVRRTPRSAVLRKERRELHHELGLIYTDLAMPGEAMAQLGIALDLSRGPQESGEINAAMQSVTTRK